MSIRNKIAAALGTTAEQLSPGSASATVRRADMYLGDIDGQDELQMLYAMEQVSVAAPIFVEEKRPDGDPVTITKKREGLIVVFSDSFVLARDKGFGFTKTEALGADEVSIEAVTAIVDGKQTPALRISSDNGKRRLTVAIAQARHASDPPQQAVVRDRILELLTGAATE